MIGKLFSRSKSQPPKPSVLTPYEVDFELHVNVNKEKNAQLSLLKDYFITEINKNLLSHKKKGAVFYINIYITNRSDFNKITRLTNSDELFEIVSKITSTKWFISNFQVNYGMHGTSILFCLTPDDKYLEIEAESY